MRTDSLIILRVRKLSYELISRGNQSKYFMVMVEVCSAISDMGVDLESPEACAKVIGSTKLFTIQMPCLSSVGVLWQFKVLFPCIQLEFVEEVRASGNESSRG